MTGTEAGDHGGAGAVRASLHGSGYDGGEALPGAIPGESHPERRRDRPCEASATAPIGGERCQIRRGPAPVDVTTDLKEIDHEGRSTRLKGCSAVYPLEALFACDRCFGPLEVGYDDVDAPISREAVEAGPPTLWRYADFLPVPPPAGGLPVGRSPLIRADRLAAELGLDCDLYVKTETSNPTHSFKDRVVAVAAAKAIELGYEALACASTGNLAGATAAAAAALGLPAYIFVPADLEREKIVAAAAYGATVFAVDGSYDDVNRLCSELAYERPWAFVNVSMRAYYSEGSKTIALETAEDLGWRAPDRVVAPIASGSLYTKILQGFREGRAAGSWSPAPIRSCTAPRARDARRSPRRLRRMPIMSCPSGRGASPSRSRSAIPRTACSRSAWRGPPAARSSRPTMTSSSTASG